MIYIGGIFNQFLPLSLNALTEGENLEFRVVTSQASTLVVNWGDGTSDVYETTFSGGLHSVEISHTYSVAYTGNMEISCTSGNEKIIRFDNFNTNTNIVVFTLDEIGAFTGLQRFECLDSNAITGDISELQEGLISFICQGNNTTTGDIVNLPSTLTRYSNGGLNSTYGDIADLKEGLVIYENRGSNVTAGDIFYLPTTLTTYLNWGNNTTTGDIADLKTSLTYYNNIGNNTTTGDIANLKPQLLTYQNWGSNTTTGNISSLKNTLTLFSSTSNNASNIITGDLSDLSTKTSLTHFNCIGFNTISGDISLISPNIVYFSLQGNSNDLSYPTASAPNRIWANNMQFVYINPTDGSFNDIEIDALLIDLALVSTWQKFAGVTPSGIYTSENRTSASDTAVLTLSGTLENGGTPLSPPASKGVIVKTGGL